MSIPYNTFNFENGIRLIYLPRKDNNISSISVFCEVGSINEIEKSKGMSHFLEHMLFKGTTKRPNPTSISGELDQMGAYFNAYTGQELTSYIVKVNSDFIEDSIHILADMLLNSKLDKNDIKMEKEVVIEEINKGYDEPPREVIENAYEIMFRGNVLKHRIGSDEEHISKYTRKDVFEYYKKFYVSNNIILSIVSNIPFKDIIKYVNKSDFHKFKPNINLKQNPTKLPLQKQPRFKVVHKTLEQVHLIVGFPTESMYSNDRFALDMLKIILAGNMSSRLFVDLRENNGLSYNVSMDIYYHKTCGGIFIQTSLNKDSLIIKNQSNLNNNNILDKFKKGEFTPGGLPIILENLKRLKHTLVSEEELNKAKGYIKGSFILEIENSHSVSDYFGQQLLFRHNPIENIGYLTDKYDKITSKQIMEMSQKYFDFEKLNISIIGEYVENDIKEFIHKYCFEDTLDTTESPTLSKGYIDQGLTLDEMDLAVTPTIHPVPGPPLPSPLASPAAGGGWFNTLFLRDNDVVVSTAI